jgi:5-methylcytosine-specific restriction enzyme A
MVTMPKTLHKESGRRLNERWGVHAQHALYGKNGTWYHRLTRFPGALFDVNGYVLFEAKDEYLKCPHLHLGKQTNCPGGISSIPNYVQVRGRDERASDLDEPEGVARALCVTNRIVRDTPLARRIKRLHRNKCQVCGLTLALSGGESYAEAHHIKPLGFTHHGPDVDENIICVCPNCHAQLDYGAIALDKATLQLVPGHNIKDDYVEYHNSLIYKGSK